MSNHNLADRSTVSTWPSKEQATRLIGAMGDRWHPPASLGEGATWDQFAQAAHEQATQPDYQTAVASHDRDAAQLARADSRAKAQLMGNPHTKLTPQQATVAETLQRSTQAHVRRAAQDCGCDDQSFMQLLCGPGGICRTKEEKHILKFFASLRAEQWKLVLNICEGLQSRERHAAAGHHLCDIDR